MFYVRPSAASPDRSGAAPVVKITGTQSIGASLPGAPRKAAQSGGPSFKDTLKASSSGGAKAAAGTARTSSVDALLAIQEVPDATTGRSRGLAMARDLLDGLEEIRRGLLMGSIPTARLKRIADMVRQRKAITTDPEVTALLEEIDLRASVELAKLGIYL